MVKLIATDMDGTLLDDKKRLPAEFPQLLKVLTERKVAFAVASGRSYPALQTLFQEKTDSLLLICDNGAHVRIPGHPPVYQCMPFSVVHAVLVSVSSCPMQCRYYAELRAFIIRIQQKHNFKKKFPTSMYNLQMLPIRLCIRLRIPLLKLHSVRWTDRKRFCILLCKASSAAIMKS